MMTERAGKMAAVANRLLQERALPIQVIALALSLALLPAGEVLGGQLTHLQPPGFGPDPYYVGVPAAATDGDKWVAVFAGGAGRGLRARTIASTGAPVGESAIHVAGDAIGPHASPAIAWIGDRYVAAFQDSLHPPTIHFVELDRDGRALPGTERPVAPGLGSPQLCWNGSRLLLLGGVSGTYGGLRGHILDPSGSEPARIVEFVDDSFYQVSCAPKENGFVLAGTWWFGLDVYALDHEGIVARARIDEGGPTASDYRPQNAHVIVDGARIHMAWIGRTWNNFVYDDRIQSAVLDGDLKILRRFTTETDHPVAIRQMFLDQGQPKAVALAGTDVAGGFAASEIQVLSFDDDGAVLGRTTLADLPRINRDPTLLRAASGYALIWFNDGAYRSVRGFVTPSLSGVTPRVGEVLSRVKLSQSAPMIASAGSSGVVAWTETAADGSSIFTAAVDRDGVVSNPRLFGRSTIHNVRLTSGEGQVFLSWQYLGALAGIPLAPDGAPLAPQPWRLSSLDHIAGNLDVTWNGDGFFFAYQAGGRIWGARAGPAALDTLKPLTVPQPQLPGMSAPGDGTPLIAATSKGMLLLWTSTAVFECVGPPCGTRSTYHSVTLSRDGIPTGEQRAREQQSSRLIASGERFVIVTGPHGCVQKLDENGAAIDAEPLCVSPSLLEITETPGGIATAWTPPGDRSFIVVNEIPRDGSPLPTRLFEPPMSSGATIASLNGRLLFGLTQVVDEETKAREAFIATEDVLEPAPPRPLPPTLLRYVRTSTSGALLHWMRAAGAIGTMVEVDAPTGRTGRVETGEAISLHFSGRPYPVRLRSWGRGGVSAPGPWVDASLRTRPVRR
jgi:hypothetical protein